MIENMEFLLITKYIMHKFLFVFIDHTSISLFKRTEYIIIYHAIWISQLIFGDRLSGIHIWEEKRREKKMSFKKQRESTIEKTLLPEEQQAKVILALISFLAASTLILSFSFLFV